MARKNDRRPYSSSFALHSLVLLSVQSSPSSRDKRRIKIHSVVLLDWQSTTEDTQSSMASQDQGIYTAAEEFVGAQLDSLPPTFTASSDYDGGIIDDYEEQPTTNVNQTYGVPEFVKNFIRSLYRAFTERRVDEMQILCEAGFIKITERAFSKSAWPDADRIAPLVNNGEGTIDVPTLDQRFESYYNYCNLFNCILSAKAPVRLELPHQWLWNIIDEFIYQFQSFSLYRYKLKHKQENDLAMLRDHPKVWNVHGVLNVLHSLVEKSQINSQLKAYNNGDDPKSVADEFGNCPLYKMLGYFSLIGLLRLHSLLGDYYQAIKVLENVQLNKKSLYAVVPACQVTTYYYVGFAYLMMRRYQDAIRSLSNILLYIQRTKNMLQDKSYQIDQIAKKELQMYALLAMAWIMCPCRIDESVLSMLGDKYDKEKFIKLQQGNLQQFEDSFAYACPKFVSPVVPDYDTLSQSQHKAPYQFQLKNFVNEVKQQVAIPIIRSYLKLYTTMPVAKLAAFLDMDEDNFRAQLLSFKHKMSNLVWTKGQRAIDGEFQTSSGVSFFIDEDMIHINDCKVVPRYSEFFLQQIRKYNELVKGLS
ncbi:Eukaryotic translation initiation factor 3 subunit L [Trichoplax sp. H2]|nr:Eukaryotic translation initiation factor 3 subunit L [Trichoplax sp. H2]|eukprot:RDD37492.1 Eukaryotic translation initiation factor 3 subunit L [Trichoplax sp. H2]